MQVLHIQCCFTDKHSEPFRAVKGAANANPSVLGVSHNGRPSRGVLSLLFASFEAEAPAGLLKRALGLMELHSCCLQRSVSQNAGSLPCAIQQAVIDNRNCQTLEDRQAAERHIEKEEAIFWQNFASNNMLALFASHRTWHHCDGPEYTHDFENAE